MIETNVDLKAANTMALPCIAAAVACINDLDDLQQALTYADEHKLPTAVIGGGSNVLLPPRLKALVLKPVCEQAFIEEDTDGFSVRAYAGKNWHELVEDLLAKGCGGLENLALIPGLVGASVIQNIGAYGVEVGDFVVSVEVYDIERRCALTLTKQECLFAYRDSLFKQSVNRYWVNAVCLRLPKYLSLKYDYPALKQYLADTPDVSSQHVFDAVVAIRSEKLPDPNIIPNSGSFFKNPVVSHSTAKVLQTAFPAMPQYQQANGDVKLAAGWLIEQCGWKAKQLGAVGMHAKQALVLVNQKEASLDDVLALQDKVHHAVSERFSVELEREPVLV